MKPLPEEIAIQNIFDIAKKAGYKVPEIFDVQFCCKPGILGMANEQAFYVSANYPGEMGCDNPSFVKTVCHELIHFNGFLHHKESFWQNLSIINEHVTKVLKGG